MSRRGSIIFGLAIVLAGSVGSLVAPYVRTAKLATRQLPGFTLAVPAGKIVRDDFDYARGTFTVKSDGDVLVGANWSPSDGSELTPEELEVMA
jgi:hypothetical protein